MRVCELPSQDRPRERLLRLGADALSDAELLAILIRAGRPGLSAVDIGLHLLSRHGGLVGLASCPASQLRDRALGIADAKLATLLAAFALSRRVLWAEHQRQVLRQPGEVRTLLIAQFRGDRIERMVGVFVDNSCRLMAIEELARGTVNQATVHPREIVRRALELSAAGVILAHNHPGGTAEASAPDIALTRRVQQALDLVEIKLHDHFIIADQQAVSMAESGLL